MSEKFIVELICLFFLFFFSFRSFFFSHHWFSYFSKSFFIIVSILLYYLIPFSLLTKHCASGLSLHDSLSRLISFIYFPFLSSHNISNSFLPSRYILSATYHSANSQVSHKKIMLACSMVLVN